MSRQRATDSRFGRLVWGGRYGAAVGGFLNESSRGRAEVRDILSTAGELIILDPLSFPWELLHRHNLDIPLVVVIPNDLDASAIGAALDSPLRSVLTPVDRLVESRPDVRSALERRWGLGEEVWVDLSESPIRVLLDALAERSGTVATDPIAGFGILRREVGLEEPDVSARSRKGAWLQVRRLCSDALTAAMQTLPSGRLRVVLVGPDPVLARALAVDCNTEVAWCETVDGLSRCQADHVIMLSLPRVPADERVELLRAAHQSVRPAGVLVVIGTVVIGPDESRALIPSMRELVEELNDASGLALHVDDLRSVRWHGERWIRGVVLSGTSLSAGRSHEG